MAEFRKFGFFGESSVGCDYPRAVSTSQEIWGGMEMFNVQTNQKTDFGFPLDLAMKIFWEAETFTITTNISIGNTIVAQISGGCPTASYTTTTALQWGNIPLASPVHTPPKKALDLMCKFFTYVVRDGVFDLPLDTFGCDPPPILQGGVDPEPFQGSANYRVLFEVLSMPYKTDDGYLHAPFFLDYQLFRSGGNGFASMRPSKITNALSYENSQGCTWVTPWGTATSPVYGYINTTSVFMTINVTAADPNERYRTK